MSLLLALFYNGAESQTSIVSKEDIITILPTETDLATVATEEPEPTIPQIAPDDLPQVIPQISPEETILVATEEDFADFIIVTTE